MEVYAAQDIYCAFDSLTTVDRKMSDAVEARKELDLRIGTSLTRLMTLRLRRSFELPQNVISYGPCQFPCLGFVVARWVAIQTFQPEKFYYLDLSTEPDIGFSWSRGSVKNR